MQLRRPRRRTPPRVEKPGRSTAPPTPRRPWALPPALLRDPKALEPFDGANILAEFPEHGGLLLWQTYRDALLWARARPERREGLFRRGWTERERRLAHGASFEPPLRLAVGKLSAAVRERGAGARAAANASVAVAEHLAQADAPDSAVAFAVLAAVLDPGGATFALFAGKMACRFGRYVLAEPHLRRAITLARRSRDWATYGAAHATLGECRHAAGDTAGAIRTYRRTLRVARRHGVPLGDARGRAARGLLRIALNGGELDAARAYANAALRFYDPRSADYPLVAVDAAELALRQARYDDAHALLAGAAPASLAPDDQLRRFVLQLQVSRALGTKADADVERAWETAARIVVSHGDTPHAVRMLLTLAEAVESTLGSARADSVVTRALGIAARTGSEALIAECRDYLRRIRDPRVGDGTPASAPAGAAAHEPVDTGA